MKGPIKIEKYLFKQFVFLNTLRVQDALDMFFRRKKKDERRKRERIFTKDRVLSFFSLANTIERGTHE